MRSIKWRILFMSIGLLGILGCAGERPKNLGVSNGKLATCSASPNCVSSQAADDNHRIAPLTFTSDPDAAFAHLKQLLAGRKDTKIVDHSPGYLLVELRTTFFVDDGEFLLDRTGGVIHIRSASRLGYSDLGKNRSRMEEIRRDFAKVVLNP